MNERVLDLLKSGFVRKKDLEHTEGKRKSNYLYQEGRHRGYYEQRARPRISENDKRR